MYRNVPLICPTPRTHHLVVRGLKLDLPQVDHNLRLLNLSRI
jgi:hypothetical protein